VLLAKIEEKNEGKTENYLNFWREKQNLEDQIHQKERELLNFSTTKNQYAVELFLSEELTTTDIEDEEESQDIQDLSCYGVNRECDGLPTMELKIIDIRPAGVHPVYDIEVEKTHSFLANGIVAHNCMVSHGAARFTRGRLYDASDKYQVHVCRDCGMIAAYNDKMGIHCCRTCDNRTNFAYVEIPYACKLLFQELQTMNIAPRIMT
jgi:ribosomal protein L37AE/L43A